MASSSSSSPVKTLLLLSAIFFSTTCALNSSSTLEKQHLSFISSVCKSTPYPDVCFNSLKLSISIDLNPTIITLFIQTVQIAISESVKLSNLFPNAGLNVGLIEKQRGAIQDCIDLQQITTCSLQKSLTRVNSNPVSGNGGDRRILSDTRTFLSGALTNKNTCLEGLDSATGPLKPLILNSLISTYKHISNSLSIISQCDGVSSRNRLKGTKNRRLLSFPTSWVSRKSRRILEKSGEEYDPSEVITVAVDGSGNFSSISEAIKFAPKDSEDRVIIYVKAGTYKENVEISQHKTNIVLLGDGSDVTVITGNRSVGDGWTTFRSATVAVAGDGFLARGITFENTAGPQKHQAVALRINADLTAVYQCNIVGYQDTLYTHSFRQFYRECEIYGTVDFIFGNSAAVFQGCNIVARLPMSGQFNAITAHARDSPDENTGISIQNCSILATEDLYSNHMSVKSYLGRPWKVYSTTVYMQSYIDDFIHPQGWKEWDGDLGLDTLYYGEYDNNGPKSDTNDRVTWPGYHVMSYDDASNYTTSELITGDEWLDSTSFPYDSGV